ncbi:hypothetical protein JHK86_035243 [Glycine max]|nr:hypothetical protein JHK86_035243 [Glycine max]
MNLTREVMNELMYDSDLGGTMLAKSGEDYNSVREKVGNEVQQLKNEYASVSEGIGDTMHSDVPHEANVIIMEVIKILEQKSNSNFFNTPNNGLSWTQHDLSWLLSTLLAMLG